MGSKKSASFFSFRFATSVSIIHLRHVLALSSNLLLSFQYIPLSPPSPPVHTEFLPKSVFFFNPNQFRTPQGAEDKQCCLGVLQIVSDATLKGELL